MIQIRSADQRGGGDHGWLKTHHTSASRTIGIRSGWDSVRCASSTKTGSLPITDFRTHPHRDMEIITYVLEGKLSTKTVSEQVR